MTLLGLILSFSILMWYCIDRLKLMWEGLAYGKYITMAVAAVFAAGLSYAYNLDIVYALELVQEVTPMGQVLTALLLMGGSSAISEVIQKIKV